MTKVIFFIIIERIVLCLLNISLFYFQLVQFMNCYIGGVVKRGSEIALGA